MQRLHRRPSRTLPGLVAVLTFVTVGVLPAAAATRDDCGGGVIDLLQATDDPTTIVGARVRNVDTACDGQPVGVQFRGNAQGDPDQPSVELARAYSDEDPCSGAGLPHGVLRDGAVTVALCPGAASSGHVDGRMLTDLRLLTTLDAPPPVGGPDDEPVAAPDPVDEPLPATGAAIMRSVLLGAAMVLVGTGLVRGSRRAARLRW